MSLRIRRGSDADRLGVRFDQGEIVWVNSTSTSRPAYKLYVGDGVTLGGRDIVETSAGTNLVYNTNTGRLDVSGLTTDDIAAGTNNQFFTNQLAQNAVAELFANGTMTGIEFVYNDLENKIDVTVTATGTGGSGIESIVEDLTPALGGDLNLNAQDITGTGNINITGNVIATGTLAVTTGLGANLSLNGFNLTGAGDINVTGAIATTGTITASSGLGADLSLNSFNIEGNGNIDISGAITLTGDISTIGDLFLNSGDLGVSGTISVTTGLGRDLDLNNYSLVGFGNIDIVGDIDTVGVITTSSVTANSVATDNINTSDGDAGGLNIFAVAGNDLSLSFANGTAAEPLTTNPGGFIGNIAIKGYNGIVYQFASGILSEWESDAVLTDDYPKATLKLATGTGEASPVFATLNSAGVFSAPVLQPGTYADATARDAAITVPVAGMMVFLIDGTGAGVPKFQGYTGAAWVDLN